MGLGEGLRCAVYAQSDFDAGALPNFETGDCLFPLVSENIEHVTELLDNPELGDHSLAGTRETGTQLVRGNLRRVLHYDGDEVLLARAMGTDTFADGGTAENTHTLTMKAEPDDAFSFALDKGHATWGVAAAVVDGFNLSVVDGRVQCEYPVMGRLMDQDASVTWGNVTERSTALYNHILFRHGQCWLNDGDGAALSSSNEITDLWQGFTLNFSNNKQFLFRNGLYTVLPTRVGRKSWSGTIELGRHTDDNRVDDIVGRTLKKMRWVFTHPTSGESFTIHHIGVRFGDGIPGTDGAGRRTQSIPFSCERVTANPTGESDVLPYIVNVSEAPDPSVS